MKKIATLVVMAIISLPAAAVTLAGLIAIEMFALARKRANRGTLERIKITPERRERFEADLSEAEYKVMAVGPTLATGGHA